MPPSSTTGIPIGRMARASTRGRSARGIGGSIGKLRRWAVIHTTTIIAPAISRPGSTPPRKSAATDAFAISAYRIIGIDGGMIGPSTEEAATIAAAKPRG